jgi:tol-pal system protein YbgF
MPMKISLTNTFRTALLAGLVAASCVMPSAHAALFSDDEARRAILDIRARLDALNARLDSKSDKTSSLDLAGQNERLNQEIARLRGQVEMLTNELANEQRRQKDFYNDLDARLRKLEPQRLSFDGKDIEVAPNEQKTYDAALAYFKAGDYKNASSAFSNFLRLYPQSGYAASAHYWLGNTYYALRDYKNAIATQQTVVRNYPNTPKAPDALLNIASCYTELRDRAAAKKTLESLTEQYPESPAAQTAKERLAALR